MTENRCLGSIRGLLVPGKAEKLLHHNTLDTPLSTTTQ